MKPLILAAALISAFSTTATANNILVLTRGTNPNTGVHAVTYLLDGERMQVTKAEFDAAGIDIFDFSEVASYLNAQHGGRASLPDDYETISGKADDTTAVSHGGGGGSSHF